MCIKWDELFDVTFSIFFFLFILFYAFFFEAFFETSKKCILRDAFYIPLKHSFGGVLVEISVLNVSQKHGISSV